MIVRRIDPELRVYNFAKVATLVVLVSLFVTVLVFGSKKVALGLDNRERVVIAGETFTLSGTGKHGEQIQVVVNDTSLGETRVDASNNWSLSAEAPMQAGVYELRLVQGQNGEQVKYVDKLTVSTEEIEQPVAAETTEGEVVAVDTDNIFKVYLDLLSDPYAFANGSTVLSGTAPFDTKVLLLLDDQVVSETIPDADGNWEQQLVLDQAGAYDLRVAIADLAGSELDSTEPIRVVQFVEPTLQFSEDAVVKQGEVALFGRAEPMARLAIEVNGVWIDETEVSERGGWRWIGELPVSSEYAIRTIMLNEQDEPIIVSEVLTLVMPTGVEVVTPQAGVGISETVVDAGVEVVTEEVDTEETAVVEEAIVEDVVVEAVEAVDTEEEAIVEVEEEAEVVEEVDAVVTGAVEEVKPLVTAVPIPLSTLKLPDVLASDGRFNTLYAALDLTGNIFSLKLDEAFTIFAPTDAAFGRLPERVLVGWQNNTDALRKLLLHHMVRGEFSAETLIAGDALVMADGQELAIGEGRSLDGRLLGEELVAKNGVIHALEQVMLTPSDFAETKIDGSGVATFKGSDLTIVGSAEAGAIVLVELNGQPYGEAIVNAEGFWSVTGVVVPGEYQILAYALDTQDTLQNVSSSVLLTVEE